MIPMYSVSFCVFHLLNRNQFVVWSKFELSVVLIYCVQKFIKAHVWHPLRSQKLVEEKSSEKKQSTRAWKEFIPIGFVSHFNLISESIMVKPIFSRQEFLEHQSKAIYSIVWFVNHMKKRESQIDSHSKFTFKTTRRRRYKDSAIEKDATFAHNRGYWHCKWFGMI